MQKHIKLLGAIFTAILALGAITANAAMAENPELKPSPEGKEFTITSPAGNIKGLGQEIKCEKDSGTGKFFGGGGTTGPYLGTLTVTFTGCKTAGGTMCHSLGDPNGTILVLAEFHLVTVNLPKTGELNLAILLLLTKLIHVECGTILFLFGGQLLLEFLNLKQNTKFHKAAFESKEESGKQVPLECLTPTGLCSGKTWGLYLEIEGSRNVAIELTGEDKFEYKEAGFETEGTW